ncbi:metal ion ABC transporter substrate-binding protein [Pseudomonas argentinensis]|uniref:ABC-type Zn uptake system ZnuABC, Zn-binding component ZnuA n=1 Tax=Phytopseudomonas argentinensis TaxID=289370 RepID=A0A1I3NKT5_9GAMM|nr:zinc ABC transporter substrate-binding protein [Pseudomonas argentinensis]KAB0549918.1 metal ion ABC transporter substrate-binding protein [Pseudomonas argentinensis]SFJ09777.1 ABC-type Zn uptake system ZnuABC, Zn-binding component ZnuA [Pseudomonas argentinensis]
MSLTVFSAPLRAVRWLCVALLLGATTGVLADTAQPRVLVALPALHALAASLCKGTRITAVRIPADAAVPMQSQANALLRLDPGVFQQADAVITLSSLWRADPLFATARRHNLRIVEIDASRSWDPVKPGVAVTQAPGNDVPWAGADDQPGAEPSPYAWLGAINAMRMAAIIAADLARLSPEDVPRIARNLSTLENRLRQLKADYGPRLAQIPDLRVLSLASEFVYLFGEFDIFVDGWFVRQDIDWSPADREALTHYLREREIKVVVHKWAPDAAIAQAIEAGGARLLILDAGNPGVLAEAGKPYEDLLRADLDAVLAGFAPSSPATPAVDHP